MARETAKVGAPVVEAAQKNSHITNAADLFRWKQSQPPFKNMLLP